MRHKTKKSNNIFTTINIKSQIPFSSYFKVRLWQGNSSDSLSFSFSPSLYASPKHVETQFNGKRNAITFLLSLIDNDSVIALCHIHELSPTHWESPVSAPFGGIEQSEKCPIKALNYLITFIFDFIRQRSGNTLSIKLPTIFYRTTELKFYLNAGFRLKGLQSNFHIPVSETLFIDNIHRQEKRRLLKCKRAGFHVEKTLLSTEEIADFIYSSRTMYGYDMTISMKNIKDLLNNFPDRFLTFSVRDSEKVIALTITVVVDHKILYNFLPADLPAYRTYSPMVLLSEYIYAYCQENAFEILDLGTAVDRNGELKPGLATFKRNIGAIECSKSTIIKYF